MIKQTIKATLVAKKDGIYTVYVFQDESGQYYMCTKLPNWGTEYNLQIGDSGFVTIEQVEAGESYYDRNTEQTVTYKFSNIYFKDFIKDTKQDDIILV